VLTGVSNGEVDVTVTLHQAEPVPDHKDWQEIVEISAHSASGELMVRAMMDDLDGTPLLSFNGPGDYRLRIHARGRESAYETLRCSHAGDNERSLSETRSYMLSGGMGVAWW
jgi:hypothetical protein